MATVDRSCAMPPYRRMVAPHGYAGMGLGLAAWIRDAGVAWPRALWPRWGLVLR
jgi:hypothetical protein